MHVEHALSRRVMEDVVRVAREAAGVNGPSVRSFYLLEKAQQEIIRALVCTRVFWFRTPSEPQSLCADLHDIV